MPFMASVNKLSLYVGIPLLFLIYLSYVLGSYLLCDAQGRQQAIDSHFENVEKRSDINALVLGGSNAVFSVSADMLTNQTPYHFYNASIVNEGFSSRNYFEFIQDLFSPSKAEKIEIVIFSSILFVRDLSHLLGFEGQAVDILGQKRFPSLLPEKTFARFLIDQIKPAKNGNKFYGNVTSTGDFNFEGFPCDYDAAKEEPFESLDLGSVLSLIQERIEFVSSKFPNARITIVFPMEYDAEPSLRNAYFDQMKSRLNEEGIEAIFQQSTQNESLICDSKHHTNPTGREFRTNDLIDQLYTFELL